MPAFALTDNERFVFYSGIGTLEKLRVCETLASLCHLYLSILTSHTLCNGDEACFGGGWRFDEQQ